MFSKYIVGTALSLSLVVSTVFVSGCKFPGTVTDTVKNMTPEQRLKAAGDAGKLAAVAYLGIEKPTKETAAQIKLVMDLMSNSLKNYKEGGFSQTKDDLGLAIDKVIVGDDKAYARQKAKALSGLLLSELDKLFDKHPDWKTKGDEVSGLVANFCLGASKAFDEYAG